MAFALLRLHRTVHKGILSQAGIRPLRNEYSRQRGRGAYRNDHRLRVSSAPSDADCLIGTGFSFVKSRDAEAYLAMFKTHAQTAGTAARLAAWTWPFWR